MMKRVISTAGFFSTVLIGCLLCFSAAHAKKPDNPGNGGGKGGGDVPGGTIYFIHDNAVWGMNSDGSNAGPVAPRVDTFSDPSRQRHGGERWFTNRNSPNNWQPTFPNGGYLVSLELVSESGTTIPLVSQPDLEILSPGVWTMGDHSVSFFAERWVTDESGSAAVEAGLYQIDVAYAGGDVSQPPTGSVAGSLEFVADFSAQMRAGPGGFHVDAELAGHSWDPTLSAVTFGIRTAWSEPDRTEEIWVADLTQVETDSYVPPDALTLLHADRGEGWPEWSPDGTRISFVSWDGLYIYDFLTTRFKLLQRIPSDSWGVGKWSPDGSHFAISHWDNFSGYDAIYRFSAKVSGKTELTQGLCPPDASFNCVLITLGWRE